MKTKNILLTIIGSLVLLWGCEQLPEGPFLKTTITTPDITAPAEGSSYTITAATETANMPEFKWDPADFGFQAGVTYTLQVTITGDFKDANDIAVANSSSVTITNEKMNTTLLILGADTVATQVKCRIKAVVNAAVAAVYSDTLTISVKPFEKIINYPKLYVPGDYQGWSANNPLTIISSVKSDEKYEGYLYFNVATSGMKFLKVPAWEEANTIGDPDPSGTSKTLKIGGWGGNNINVSGGPGVFKINANLVDATYNWVKTDWGIIGDATAGGWSTDQNMTYDPATNLWTCTLNLTGGKKIKFRANDGWDINLGDNGNDKKLEYGGSDIPITSDGNYTVTLDLSKPVYKYRIVKN